MPLSPLTVASFTAIALAVFLLGRRFTGRGRPRDDQLGSQRTPACGALTGPLAAMFPTSDKKRRMLRQDLLRAGHYHRGALDDFLATRNLALMIWAVFVAALLVALVDAHAAWTRTILACGGLGLALIYSLPTLVLGARAGARSQRIQYALPDALDMITMTMAGGLPMQAALARVSRELSGPHPDLACELAILARQTDAGSLEQALRQFSERMELPEIVGLTTLVRHAERLGGNVAGAFRDFADSVRRERRLRAEERGNKATVKMLFPLVFLLSPPIYILLLGPAVLELRSFVNRENQPGGVLRQELEVAPPPGLPAADEDLASAE